MATLKQQILELLNGRPGLSDREVTNLLRGRSAPQQPVNIACRDMHRSGLLERRQRSDGIIGNFPSGNAMAKPQANRLAQSTSERGLMEDAIKDHLAKWLQAEGWTVQVAWGKTRGVDIDARRGDEAWLIEVKGAGSLQPMRVSYFLAILGETLQRMSEASARYSIALPDMAQFRGLWQRLPELAKQRTGITAIFVSPDGRIVHLDRQETREESTDDGKSPQEAH